LTLERDAHIPENFTQGASTLGAFSEGIIGEALVNIKSVSAVFASV